MSRYIRFIEPESGLAAKCVLLDDKAPLSAEFLWQLAQSGKSFDAIHAMWTGPELSCPLPAAALPEALSKNIIPSENATSYPKAGEVVVACLAAGSVKGLPPGNFFDLGIFYGEGGRLLMPFGWIQANVCAEILEDELLDAQQCLNAIRQNGACQLSIEKA